MTDQVNETRQVLPNPTGVRENPLLHQFRTLKSRWAERAARRGKKAIIEPLTNFVEDRAEKITRRLKALTEQVLQVAFFFSSAVSCYFIGLFSNFGLEYFSVVDKQSMIGSIFLLTALFSSMRVVVSILPVLWAEPQTIDTKTHPTSTKKSGDPNSKTVGNCTWLVACAGFSIILIGLFYTAFFAVIGFILYVLFWNRGWRARLIAGLLLGLGLGFLRAEYLRDAPASTAIQMAATEAGLEQLVPVNVIMSAERGLLVVMGNDRSVRFIPWEQIAWIGLNDTAEKGWFDKVRLALGQYRQNLGAWLNQRTLGPRT